MFCGFVFVADMDRGGPNALADLDRWVQIRGGSKSAVTPPSNVEHVPNLIPVCVNPNN